jgi:hypothetical protein
VLFVRNAPSCQCTATVVPLAPSEQCACVQLKHADQILAEEKHLPLYKVRFS